MLLSRRISNLPDAARIGVETNQLHEIRAVLITQSVNVNLEILVLLEVVHCVHDAVGLVVSDLFFAPAKDTGTGTAVSVAPRVDPITTYFRARPLCGWCA